VFEEDDRQRAAPGWLWAFRASRGQSPVLFRTSEDVGYDVPPLLLLLALFTEVRGRTILGRWDEKADPPYAVPLEGLQELYGL
jgi:hypothetical protein